MLPTLLTRCLSMLAGAASPTAFMLLALCSMCMNAAAHGTSSQQGSAGAPVLSSPSDETPERTLPVLNGAAERIVVRLLRDLNLTAHQADLCRVFFAEYMQARRDAKLQANAMLETWKRQYWAERLPNEPGVLQFPPNDESDIGWKRVRYTPAEEGQLPEMVIYPLEDEEYEQVRIMQSARIRHEGYELRSQSRDRLYQNIASVLDESQFVYWERAKQRVQIAIDDALYPARGGRLEWHSDMLGLIEEACSPDSELEYLGQALLQPLSHAFSGNERLESVAVLGEQFEAGYSHALQSLWRIQHELHRRRAKGLSPDDQRGEADGDNWLSAMAHVWRVRLAFVQRIKSIARDMLGEQPALRWEERFFARCCPWLFLPDTVDTLAQRIEEEDDIPNDLRETLDLFITQYEQDRRRLRLRLARMAIDLRCASGEDALEIQQEFDPLHAKRDPLEQRTMRILKITLESQWPTFFDSSEVTAPEDEQ